jgi:hypothetical protein
MISPESLYIKNFNNELSFLPVTHTICFNIRLSCYEFLKTGFTAGQTGYTGAWSGFWPVR